MAVPLIPIAITLATLGGLYYTRSPVSQLRQGKAYKIFVNVDSSLFQGAAAGSPEVANTIRNFLNQAGFSPITYSTFQKGSTPNLTTYIYNGTWTKGESTINAPATPGVSASFYEKLPLL